MPCELNSTYKIKILVAW